MSNQQLLTVYCVLHMQLLLLILGLLYSDSLLIPMCCSLLPSSHSDMPLIPTCCSLRRAFFDVRVVNLRNTSIVTLCCRKEQEKQRSYDERIREVEHGSFAPLVFSTSGGMGPAARVVYKRIASLIANKQKKHYSLIISYIHCKITFSLLRSAIMCLRRCRTICQHSAADLLQLEIAAHESRLTSS